MSGAIATASHPRHPHLRHPSTFGTLGTFGTFGTLGTLRSFELRHPFERGRCDLMLFAPPHSDELCDDGNRDFLRRHRADIEANWRVNLFEPLGRHGPVFDKHVVNPLYLCAA